MRRTRESKYRRQDFFVKEMLRHKKNNHCYDAAPIFTVFVKLISLLPLTISASVLSRGLRGKFPPKNFNC